MEPVDQQFDLAGERFWLLLSLICLPPIEQEQRMDAIPQAGSLESHQSSRNPLRQMLGLLPECYSGWFDSFTPQVEKAEQLLSLVGEMFRENEEGKREHFTQEAFHSGEAWINVRKLAKAVLEEVDFPARDVPLRIDLKALAEFPGD